MDDMHTAEDPAPRYVPDGVNPQSWIGFEQRIQERRFRALLEQIDHAILRRDDVAARLALEEARELRPDAPDLCELNERVALIPAAPLIAPSTHVAWIRPMRALTLLAAGVALVVGIEWIRPARPLPSSRSVAAHVATPPVTAVTATPPQEPAAPAAKPEDIVVVSREPDVAIPDAVATTGVDTATNIARPAVGGPATAPFRPEGFIDARIQESPREVSDVDATEEPRGEREANVGSGVEDASVANLAEASPRQPSRLDEEAALLASVAPVHTSIGAMPMAVSSRPVVEARTQPTDEARFAQVLDRYARVYANQRSQTIAFENCNVSVKGAIAVASCRGRLSYADKPGGGERRTEPRQWTFELRRGASGEWQVERASTLRMTN
jgi:hypothetical protein